MVVQDELGFLCGDRFLVVEHGGRRSGLLRLTPLEVVGHRTGEYVVCSGTGPAADWYRNLHAHPVEELWVRNRRWRPVQRFLNAAEAVVVFGRYEGEHPETAKRLLRIMGNQYDGSDAGRVEMMAAMPMVAFTDS